MDSDRIHRNIYTGLVGSLTYSGLSYFFPPFRWIGFFLAFGLAVFLREGTMWYVRESAEMRRKNG